MHSPRRPTAVVLARCRTAELSPRAQQFAYQSTEGFLLEENAASLKPKPSPRSSPTRIHVVEPVISPRSSPARVHVQQHVERLAGTSLSRQARMPSPIRTQGRTSSPVRACLYSPGHITPQMSMAPFPQIIPKQAYVASSSPERTRKSSPVDSCKSVPVPSPRSLETNFVDQRTGAPPAEWAWIPPCCDKTDNTVRLQEAAGGFDALTAADLRAQASQIRFPDASPSRSPRSSGLQGVPARPSPFKSVQTSRSTTIIREGSPSRSSPVGQPPASPGSVRVSPPAASLNMASPRNSLRSGVGYSPPRPSPSAATHLNSIATPRSPPRPSPCAATPRNSLSRSYGCLPPRASPPAATPRNSLGRNPCNLPMGPPAVCPSGPTPRNGLGSNAGYSPPTPQNNIGSNAGNSSPRPSPPLTWLTNFDSTAGSEDSLSRSVRARSSTRERIGSILGSEGSPPAGGGTKDDPGAESRSARTRSRASPSPTPRTHSDAHPVSSSPSANVNSLPKAKSGTFPASAPLKADASTLSLSSSVKSLKASPSSKTFSGSYPVARRQEIEEMVNSTRLHDKACTEDTRVPCDTPRPKSKETRTLNDTLTPPARSKSKTALKWTCPEEPGVKRELGNLIASIQELKRKTQSATQRCQGRNEELDGKLARIEEQVKNVENRVGQSLQRHRGELNEADMKTSRGDQNLQQHQERSKEEERHKEDIKTQLDQGVQRHQEQHHKEDIKTRIDQSLQRQQEERHEQELKHKEFHRDDVEIQIKRSLQRHQEEHRKEHGKARVEESLIEYQDERHMEALTNEQPRRFKGKAMEIVKALSLSAPVLPSSTAPNSCADSDVKLRNMDWLLSRFADFLPAGDIAALACMSCQTYQEVQTFWGHVLLSRGFIGLSDLSLNLGDIIRLERWGGQYWDVWRRAGPKKEYICLFRHHQYGTTVLLSGTSNGWFEFQVHSRDQPKIFYSSGVCGRAGMFANLGEHSELELDISRMTPGSRPLLEIPSDTATGWRWKPVTDCCLVIHYGLLGATKKRLVFTANGFSAFMDSCETEPAMIVDRGHMMYKEPHVQDQLQEIDASEENWQGAGEHWQGFS